MQAAGGQVVQDVNVADDDNDNANVNDGNDEDETRPAKVGYRIPSFSGKEDRAGVMAFLLKVETAIAAAGLDAPARSQQAANLLAHSLKGNAFAWYSALKSKNQITVNRYVRLLEAFKLRYLAPLTVNEVRQMKDTLVMRNDEDVLQFRDRCEWAQCQEYEDVTEETKDTDFFKETFNKAVLQKFLEGLRRDILQQVQAQATLFDEFDEYVKAAKNVEISLLKQNKMGCGQPVMELKKDAKDVKKEKTEEEKLATMDNLFKQIEEIRTSLPTRGSNPRGGQSQQRRGGPLTCYFCGKQGHMQNKCYQKNGYPRGAGGRSRGNQGGRGAAQGQRGAYNGSPWNPWRSPFQPQQRNVNEVCDQGQQPDGFWNQGPAPGNYMPQQAAFGAAYAGAYAPAPGQQDFQF